MGTIWSHTGGHNGREVTGRAVWREGWVWLF